MLTFLAAAWSVAVKWPLTLLFDTLSLRLIRRGAAAGFAAWADDAAARGPEGIARATAARVTYLNDPLGGMLDYVAAPEVTWARRYGDCDDFSYLSAELLRRAGVASWIVTYLCWNVKHSHVVCLFYDRRAFGTIDQGYVRDGFHSLADAVAAARPPAAVAAQYVRRYARGADLIGRWIVRNGKSVNYHRRTRHKR
jgi:transglutaminase-like putative cysteine protease